jgi:hypothetical protein
MKYARCIFLQRAKKMGIIQPVSQKGEDRSGEEKVDPQAQWVGSE